MLNIDQIIRNIDIRTGSFERPQLPPENPSVTVSNLKKSGNLP